MNKVGFEVNKGDVDNVNNAIKGISDTAKKLLGAIGVSVSLAGLSRFAKECVAAASDVEQMESKFDVVFGDIREEVDAWADNFAEAVGRNKNTIKGYLADMQNLLVGFGMTREEGAKLSEEMTSLALDLASFANTDETAAVQAMTKAVMGESEAAKTLGAVLNDTTRAETMAALGIQGKYEALDQLTKMEVNYQTILRQSPDAIGDCIRSLDTYESRQRQLKASTDAFKELIGRQLLPIFSEFTGLLNTGVKAATEFARAILGDSRESNRLLGIFNRLKGAVQQVAGHLGGVANMLKLVAMTGAGLYIALNFQRIISALGSILKLVTSIRLQTLLLIAVIAALVLAVDDFVNFMKGNDSVIGVMFQKAGIDAEEMRQKIVNIWNNLKTFFSGIWNSIKGTIAPILDAIKAKIQEVFGDNTFASLGEGLAGVIETIERITQKLAENTLLQETIGRLLVLIPTVIAAVSAFKQLATAISAIQNVVKVVGKLGTALSSISSPARLAIAAFVLLAAAAYDLFSFMSGKESVIGAVMERLGADTDAARQKVIEAWGAIQDFLTTAWETIQQAAGTFVDTLKGFFDRHSEQILGTFQRAWNAVGTFLSGVWSFITQLASAIFGGVESTVGDSTDSASQKILSVWQSVLGALSRIFHAIFNTANAVFNSVLTVVEVVFGLIEQFWNRWGSTVLSFFQTLWQNIGTVFRSALEIIKGVADFVSSVFSGDWQGAWEAIKNIVVAAWEIIKATVSTAWAAVKTLLTVGLGILVSI